MYYKLKFYRIDYFKWLSKYLYVDVIGYDYPGYGNSTKVNATEENCN